MKKSTCVAALGLLWLAMFSPQRGQAQAPPAIPPSIQVPLGAAASYGLLSGSTIQVNGSAHALGKAGAASSIAPGITASQGVFAQAGNTVGTALADLQTAKNYCAAQSASAISSTLAGQTLGAGVYSIAGNATLGSAGRLTIVGDTATVVVINVTGSLTFATHSGVMLQGVLPYHLFWNVGGQV
jgi:hypothetical protein